MAVTQVEDSKNLGDDEEVSSDLQGYLEVEEGMGMWEVFCEMIGQDLEWKIGLSQTHHCRVARSPAHACLAHKSTKLISRERPLYRKVSLLSSLSTILCATSPYSIQRPGSIGGVQRRKCER